MRSAAKEGFPRNHTTRKTDADRRLPSIHLIVSSQNGLALVLGALLFIAGCSEEFTPFNTVEKFRVMSLRAEPPALAEGEVTEISGLFYVPGDDLEGISYKWSWCPIAVNSAAGGECAVSEEMFKSIAEELIRQSTDADVSALLENVPLSFDLGSATNAVFIYALPSDLLLQVCEDLLAQDIPSFAGIPDCRDKLNVVIRLEATYKKERVIALKSLPLYIDADRADNDNPQVASIVITDKNGEAVEVSALGVNDELPVLYRGEHYSIEAGIDDSESQSFTPSVSSSNPNPVPVREYLFMTWYAGGGSFEFARTTFINGEVPMKTLRSNRWSIPQSVDYPESEISLFLVLQDERGGTGWFEKRFSVRER